MGSRDKQFSAKIEGKIQAQDLLDALRRQQASVPYDASSSSGSYDQWRTLTADILGEMNRAAAEEFLNLCHIRPTIGREPEDREESAATRYREALQRSEAFLNAKIDFLELTVISARKQWARRSVAWLFSQIVQAIIAHIPRLK